jgi:phosphotransferase system enzyme I (PtsI)
LLNGTGNCIGFGIGKAKIQTGQIRKINKQLVENHQAELSRFEAAYEATKSTVEALLEKEIADTGSDGEKIFESHLAFLEDPSFVDAIRETIVSESVNAEWAVHEVGERIALILSQVESDVISERSADIRDLYNNMLRHLAGKHADGACSTADAEERSVLIMEELIPSFVMGLDKECVSALVAEKGNITAHAAILAKLKGIPAVVGVRGIADAVSEGDLLMADSLTGSVYVNPDERTLAALTCAMEQFESDQRVCNAEKGMDAITRDGRRIMIEANIGTPDEAALVSQ